MFDKIIEFFTSASIWELLLIFSARIIEVSLGTLRVIFVNKGYRKQGVILAFIEVTIWVFVASRVIVGINEQPLKGIIYSLGFASGVYVGSKIEERLAFGKVVLQAITSIDNGVAIADALRQSGHGVTSLEGQGKDSSKTVLIIYANRKGKDTIIDMIYEMDEHAMVSANELNYLKGGYLSNWRRFIK